MILKDILNRSQLICNIPIGQEGIVFYNEFLDALTDKALRNASEVKETLFTVNDKKTDFYEIPKSTLFIVDVYKDNKKVDFRNSDNILFFSEKGKYKIKYTVYPDYASSVEDVLTHNSVYDNACIYFICYKKALQEHFDNETVTNYLTSFSDYFNSAYNKRRVKSETNIIPRRPLIE